MKDIFYTVVVVGIMLGFGYHLISGIVLSASGTRAQGIVLATIMENCGNARGSCGFREGVQVQYPTGGGMVRASTDTSSLGYSQTFKAGTYAVGDSVQLVYDPNNPQNFHILDGISDSIGDVLVIAFFGGLLLYTRHRKSLPRGHVRATRS